MFTSRWALLQRIAAAVTAELSAYFFTVKFDISATMWETKLHAGMPHRNISTLVAVAQLALTFDAAGPQAVAQIVM